jgi:hypothetical protein
MLSSMLSQHHAQAHDNMLTALLITSLHHDFQNHLKWHIRLLLDGCRYNRRYAH